MICDACGKSHGGMISMGGATICRSCEPDVRAEMERLRDAGQPVNVGTIAKKIFRADHSIGSYILRDIPEELWNLAKHRAVDDGDSLRGLILKAIRAYLA